MRKLVLTLFFISLFFISEISFSEVYRWVDEKGVVYFTDDITQVPEKYRPKIEKMGMPDKQDEGKGEGELSSSKKEEIYRDQLGRGEEYWKGRMEEWRKKLKEYQERMESLRVKYNELTVKYNDSKSSAERGTIRAEREKVKTEMDQFKVKIEEANNMIEKKLPEEAELYKAKPEWLK